MRNRIIESCKAWGADIVGFAPIERFPESSAVRRLMPDAKTVIGLGFRVLRGIYRGIEEGSTYYQYSTMAVENLEETVMPMVSIRLAMMLEAEGFSALPQRKHQTIMAETDSTNPEVNFNDIYRGCTTEIQMDFEEAAILTGIGERGLHGSVLTDEYGPFIRYCFVITDAEFDGSPIYEPHICDGCGECVKACPGKAISAGGEVNVWKCAAYYVGANGTKNPFMPSDAYSEFENRLDIISGEAEVDRRLAEAIIKNTYFYPAVQHSYASSICGKACDIACYIHLEEKGVLTKKFKTPFRKREEWHFDIGDFDKKNSDE